jgi:hypothetical protein
MVYDVADFEAINVFEKLVHLCRDNKVPLNYPLANSDTAIKKHFGKIGVLWLWRR